MERHPGAERCARFTESDGAAVGDSVRAAGHSGMLKIWPDIAVTPMSRGFFILCLPYKFTFDFFLSCPHLFQSRFISCGHTISSSLAVKLIFTTTTLVLMYICCE